MKEFELNMSSFIRPSWVGSRGGGTSVATIFKVTLTLDPAEVKKEVFIRDMEMTYKCGGDSAFLNRFCEEGNLDATLKVDMR
ncbi:unnamed protein product, partial [marine sediment metagenome]